MNNQFAKNRNKMFDTMTDNSIALLFAGEAPVKRGDEKYPFSPDRNFYYLTGIEREHFILAMVKNDGFTDSVLYIEPHNGQQAKWVGATMPAEQAQLLSGITTIKYIENFENDMKVFSNKISKIYLDSKRTDLPQSYMPQGINDIFKNQNIEDLFPILSQFRVIKDEWEIDRMKKAMDITRMAIEEMMKNSMPGMMEYEIESYYDFVLTKNGVTDKAFKTIAASGKNGTTLHYSKNNCKTKENDLILVDAGAQYKWYNGDITRTFPINGKFTKKQKLVYNIVLRGQQLIIDTIKDGVPFLSLNEKLKDYYFTELEKIGLVKEKDEVFNYYYHNVSHFLGAETHDVGERNQTLKAGMVITVEPGLYIEQWGIGIRIEDDVMVTKNGCEVLTKDMIKTIEDIEKFMAENGKND